MHTVVATLLATMVADTPFLKQEDAVRGRYLLSKIIKMGRKHFVLEQQKKLTEAIKDSSHIHKGQYRKDGTTPYIIHLLEATCILIDGHVYDFKTLCAAILHDTVEDTKDPAKKEAIKKLLKRKYGVMVYHIVDLLSKRDKEDKDAVWKRMLAEQDLCILWRVLVIKYADRIHNMRTLNVLSEDDRKRKITETLAWFPIIKKRLEDTLQRLWAKRTLKNHSRLHLPHFLQNKLNIAIKPFLL